MPAGCLNTIYHRPGEDAVRVTNALIASPTVKKISFTGSTNVGSIIAGLAGKHLKPVLMELGGKAPSIVCEDANIGTAALQCALGSFLHSGQICMSAERILVHKNVVDKFTDAFKGAVDQVFGGEGRDAPILVTSLAVDKNKKLVKDAVSKGAKAIYGDVDASEDSKTRMRPVIVEGVKMIKRHTRKNQQNPQGAIVEREGTVHISNLMKAEIFDARATKRGVAAPAEK